jgi:hypothetical protein
LSGGTTSGVEFARIRKTTLYETKQSEGRASASLAILQLPGAAELKQQILTTVLGCGGGWEIVNWNDPSFLNKIVSPTNLKEPLLPGQVSGHTFVSLHSLTLLL